MPTDAAVRDAAWQAYLAEDDVSAAVDAAIQTAATLTAQRWEAVRGRVRTRHSSRPDGYCVMCRWPDGSLMRWPCPDYVDARAEVSTAEGGGEADHPKALDRVWWYHDPCRWASGPEDPNTPRWWTNCPGCGSGEGDWLQLVPIPNLGAPRSEIDDREFAEFNREVASARDDRCSYCKAKDRDECPGEHV